MRVCHSEIFNNLHYPSKPPGTQGLPHSDPVYFQAILSLAFTLTSPPPPNPQAIRNVGHPLILLAFLSSDLFSSSFLFYKCLLIFFHFYSQLKYYFLLMFNLDFSYFHLSATLGRCNNEVNRLTLEYYFQATMCLHLCYINNSHLSLVCRTSLYSCHFRDEESLGKPFKVTELQNEG